MPYEDFKINEKAIEEMAKEFAGAKILQNEEDGESEIDEKNNLMFDVFSGFKIFERLLFFAKSQTRNQKLLNFITDSQNEVQNIWRMLLDVKNDFVTGDVDFELPQNDVEILKLIQTILSSQLINLTELLSENKESTDQLINLISSVAGLLKNSLNFL